VASAPALVALVLPLALPPPSSLWGVWPQPAAAAAPDGPAGHGVAAGPAAAEPARPPRAQYARLRAQPRRLPALPPPHRAPPAAAAEDGVTAKLRGSSWPHHRGLQPASQFAPPSASGQWIHKAVVPRYGSLFLPRMLYMQSYSSTVRART
jgi:hypothetical protein